MTESSVETVRQLFGRLETGGFNAVFDLISEDFVSEVPGSLSAEPDVYEGHEGLRRYFDGFEGMLEDVRFEPLEIIDEGDAVIASVRFAGRGATSGIDVEQYVAVLIRVVDGKVVRLDPHPDLDSARRAARS